MLATVVDVVERFDVRVAGMKFATRATRERTEVGVAEVRISKLSSVREISTRSLVSNGAMGRSSEESVVSPFTLTVIPLLVTRETSSSSSAESM